MLIIVELICSEQVSFNEFLILFGVNIPTYT
jgi:hypothetical protein